MSATETLAKSFDLPLETFFERQPLSVAGVEKLLGKKALKTIPELWTPNDGGLWETRPGKPTLVEIDDPRPAVDKLQQFDEVDVSDLA